MDGESSRRDTPRNAFRRWLARAQRPLWVALHAAILGLWCPPPAPAGITVLCNPVTCASASDCGPSGMCQQPNGVGHCICTTDSQCPPGSQCLAQTICGVCPATRTPTVTPTNTPTSTPSLTPTNTPTLTPTATPTPQPNGSSCTDPSQCASGFCDVVCCDTACTGPGEQCNLPGQVGTCASVSAPAPTLTPRALLMAAALLAGIAAVALRRRTIRR